jgi:hypothetical protein
MDSGAFIDKRTGGVAGRYLAFCFFYFGAQDFVGVVGF